jgi:hypothetical protein
LLLSQKIYPIYKKIKNYLKIKLIISIDTECDKDLNWKVRQPLSFINISKLCELNEILINQLISSKLTLLLSPEVILNESSVELLKRQKQIELGTHLHLEFLKQLPDQISETELVQAELSNEEDTYYITRLTNLFIEKFNFQPLSFRAGRYGYNKYSTFDTLRNLGYLVDSSTVPKSIFLFNNGITVNNEDIEVYPFRHANGLLEVPISVVNFGNRRNWELINKIPSYRIRKYFEFLKPHQKWIRPSYEDLTSLIKNTEILISNWNINNYGDPVINMMFHSNELYPGASPYNKTWEDVEFFISRIIQYSHWLSKNYELEFCYLSEMNDKT